MIVYCPSCENPCSEAAEACPKCGHPLKASKATDSSPSKPKRNPSDEREVLKVQPSFWRNEAAFLIVVGIVSILSIPWFGSAGFVIVFSMCLFLSIILLPFAFLKCKSASLSVTTRRSILRTGILAKNTVEVLHNKVQNVNVSQGIFDRLLKIGKVGISSAGQSTVEIKIWGIIDPERIRDMIDRYRDD